MTLLTRRELFAGTAATTAALSLGLTPSEIFAAAPPAGKQAASFYRYKVGDFEVTQIADGARTFPMPDTFVVNQKKEDALKAAEEAYIPKGQVTIVFNPMVINTGSKLVLIDTGNGLGAYDQTKGAVGQLNANMQAAGIDPKNIDIVLISHFHGDHMNGLKKADGSLVYPNAEVKVPSVEQKFWADESNASKTNGFNKPNFPNVKKAFDGIKVTEHEWDKEVAPGITAIGTPGHTPGHTSYVVSSGNGKLLVQSDVTNIPMFVTHPDWHVTFDNDPNLAQTTRHKFFDMAAAEKLPVAGYHFWFPSIGHIEKAGDGYRLVPVAWNPTI
jgi:glyoxylase-like metal-dependent hydrolase (beta-lactamase superfamily II)